MFISPAPTQSYWFLCVHFTSTDRGSNDNDDDSIVRILPIEQPLETPELDRLLQTKDFQLILVILSSSSSIADTILTKIRILWGPHLLVRFFVFPDVGTLSARHQDWLDDKKSILNSFGGAHLDTIGIISMDTTTMSSLLLATFVNAKAQSLAKVLWPERTTRLRFAAR